MIWIKGSKGPVPSAELFGKDGFAPRFVDGQGHYWQTGQDLWEFDGKEIIDHNKRHPYCCGLSGRTTTSELAIAEDAQAAYGSPLSGAPALRGNRKWKVMGSKFHGMLGMSRWSWASNGVDTISFGGPWGRATTTL